MVIINDSINVSTLTGTFQMMVDDSNTNFYSFTISLTGNIKEKFK